jgi:uncharacterized membrane protein HdeD (DUF308 family)
MGAPSRGLRLPIGLCAVGLGAALTLKPFSSLDALVLFAAASLTAAGVGELLSAGPGRRSSQVAGVALVASALLVFLLPGLTVSAVAVVMGIGMVVGGLARIAGGLRGQVEARFAAVAGGLAGVVLGVLALTWPDLTVLVVALLVGPLAVILGVMQIVRALDGRSRSVAARHAHSGRRRIARNLGAVVALVLALLLVGVSSFLHEGTPTVDAFYEPTTDLPDEPGRLVRSQRFTRKVPAGASARRILYTTTGRDGKTEQASGLVVWPDTAKGPLPVILWTHGTTGVATKCAPSALDEPFEAGAFFVLDRVLAEGWALVAPDYPGLGTEGKHPYLVGRPAARSALDAVRAARELGPVKLSDRTVAWGHSQGGGAALWVGIEDGRYAPDVPVAGVAALAPASDLPALARTLQQSPAGMLFAAFVVRGYSDFYDDVVFGDYVRPAAQGIVRRVIGRCLSERATLASLGAVLTGQSIFREDLTGGPLLARLRENVPAKPTGIPTLIGQGLADELVLPDVQRHFARDLCRAGLRLDFRAYAGRDHVALVAADSPLVPELLQWTRDRFHGIEAKRRCPAGAS